MSLLSHFNYAKCATTQQSSLTVCTPTQMHAYYQQQTTAWLAYAQQRHNFSICQVIYTLLVSINLFMYVCRLIYFNMSLIRNVVPYFIALCALLLCFTVCILDNIVSTGFCGFIQRSMTTPVESKISSVCRECVGNNVLVCVSYSLGVFDKFKILKLSTVALKNWERVNGNVSNPFHPLITLANGWFVCLQRLAVEAANYDFVKSSKWIKPDRSIKDWNKKLR